MVGLDELVLRDSPQMKERKYGLIIAILSSSTAEVPAKFAAYITGKQALPGFCRALTVAQLVVDFRARLFATG